MGVKKEVKMHSKFFWYELSGKLPRYYGLKLIPPIVSNGYSFQLQTPESITKALRVVVWLQVPNFLISAMLLFNVILYPEFLFPLMTTIVLLLSISAMVVLDILRKRQFLYHYDILLQEEHEFLQSELVRAKSKFSRRSIAPRGTKKIVASQISINDDSDCNASKSFPLTNRKSYFKTNSVVSQRDSHRISTVTHNRAELRALAERMV